MIKSLKHFSFLLNASVEDIKYIIENIDEFYYRKEEAKVDKNGLPKLKRGAPQIRVLYPSKLLLKEFQSKILKKILHQLNMPKYAFGGVREKDNIRNARKHQGKKFIFTTDLRNFFPSITHRQVYDMFISNEFSPTVAMYLTKLTTYRGSLPQGTPTSTAIANLVFAKTGNKLLEYSLNKRLTFTSFVDDLTFSSSEDFKYCIPEILSIIKSDGFRISHQKTNYKTYKPLVTGIVVKNNSLDLSTCYKKQLFEENSLPLSDSMMGKIRYFERVTNKKK